MEQDREIDEVMMNIRRNTGGLVSLMVLSVQANLMLLTFLMRLAKKAMVAGGFCDRYREFLESVQGKTTVYNIPLSAERAKALQTLNQLELQLDSAKNPVTAGKIRRELKRVQKELPELEQLEKLGIKHCVLPKLNGSSQTIQVAVADSDAQPFKAWFLNHLSGELTGGEKGMEELKAFTEDNYTIFNMPFEGEEFETMRADFAILGVNYTLLPDLKVGDGYTQIAVPNADRNKLEAWFSMWRDNQISQGKEPMDMYAMDQNSYLSTGAVSQEDYVASADKQYQKANAEFEGQSRPVPWDAPLQKENCESYVKYLQDQNYEKVSISKETLVENMDVSKTAEKMQKEGYFISRIPGTYGRDQKTLLVPREQVFTADDGQTFVAFLPKNGKIYVADSEGNVTEQDFQDVSKPYHKVDRSFQKVKELKEDVPVKQASVKKQRNRPVKNRFNNFEGRDYSGGAMEQLEKKLLNLNNSTPK